MLKPLLKIGFILAFVVAVVLYLWLSGRLPAPREQDRVVHRDGLWSIIKPRGWETSFKYDMAQGKWKDTLELLAPTAQTRDRRIFVGRMRTAPTIEEVTARDSRQIADRFGDQPAWVFEGKTRLEYFWRAVFQRGGEWYELVLWLPLPEDVPNSRWWPYLQSFQALHATTQPS